MTDATVTNTAQITGQASTLQWRKGTQRGKPHTELRALQTLRAMGGTLASFSTRKISS